VRWRNKEPTPRGGIRTTDRIDFVPARSRELYFLRKLSHVVKSPKYLQDLRRFEGVEHSSFKGAGCARGLLQDDLEWDACLTEAAQLQGEHQLRDLFAIILSNHENLDPLGLFERQCQALSNDLPRMLKRKYGIDEPSEQEIWGVCQTLLQSAIKSINAAKDLRAFDSAMPSADAPIPPAL
jgi:hypothetical protein